MRSDPKTRLPLLLVLLVGLQLVPAARAQPNPSEGPGGPILVVVDDIDPFGRYFAEILRTEGFNYFDVLDIALLTPAELSAHDIVILAEMSLTAPEVALLIDWVNTGGKLITMRPDPQLAGLLGLTAAGGTLSEGYLLVSTASAPGAGIVGEPIQYHDTADLYTINGAKSLATLYADALTPTTHPAVTLNTFGVNGGQAAAFTYDLARSVVYTHQGNPDWVGQNRDGQYDIMTIDLFYGDAAGDPQPDWINLDKVAIPQADEQQRLLANMILYMLGHPWPRFWYFPSGHKAVVIMTGDQHGCCDNTASRFQIYVDQSPPGCSLDDWECVRASAFVYANSSFSNAEALDWTNLGFELGVHIPHPCNTNWSEQQMFDQYGVRLSSFASLFPSLPLQSAERTHCIPVVDWVGEPLVQSQYGLRLDTNYYYWPPAWHQNRPGMFTGSGMVMRFADLDGTIVDVYQGTTQMTDEGQTYGYTANELLDKAIGPEGYYGAFVVNMHMDDPDSDGSNAIVASAQARGVPVVSGRQMAEWLDGRNTSTFQSVFWSPGLLSFTVTAGTAARNLRGMVPTLAMASALSEITRDGVPIPFVIETIKGVQYGIFHAEDGDYEASYNELPPMDPTLTIELAGGSGGTQAGETITATLAMSGLGTFQAAGFQAFLAYDPATLTFTGATYTISPFGQPIITGPATNPAPGEIDLASGLDLIGGQTATSADALLATITFTANSVPDCTATAVTFRPHDPESGITDLLGLPATPLALVDSQDVIIDVSPPTLTLPPDVIVECDEDLSPSQTGQATASDTCDPSPTVTFLDTYGDGACPQEWVITRTWTAIDASGNGVGGNQTITVLDTTAPAVTAPDDIVVDAEVGGCEATVVVGSPTVSDNCSLTEDVLITFIRSDGKPNLSDPFELIDSPVTITWEAEDECGNIGVDVQTVEVIGQNDMLLDIELLGTLDDPNPGTPGDTVTRCITFELYECPTGTPEIVQQEIAFPVDGASAGLATDVLVLLPCGSYTCVSARDSLHTLRRRDDSFTISGPRYVSDFTDQSGGGGPNAGLVSGNLNDNEFIDILDFGIFTGQWMANYGSGDTTCLTSGRHADLSGNGTVFTEDFTFILVNFLETADMVCCQGGAYEGAIERISVAELYDLGLGELAVGDLNKDGWLDQLDMVAFLEGARPRPKFGPRLYRPPPGGPPNAPQ